MRGLDCWKDTIRIKARIGFLPDAPSLYGNLTGLELLAYLNRLQNRGHPVLHKELCDYLALARRHKMTQENDRLAVRAL